MSGQRFEYLAVKLPAGVPKGEELAVAVTRTLNGPAEDGWRLVAVYPGGQYGGGHALFERPTDTPTD